MTELSKLFQELTKRASAYDLETEKDERLAAARKTAKKAYRKARSEFVKTKGNALKAAKRAYQAEEALDVATRSLEKAETARAEARKALRAALKQYSRELWRTRAR